MIRRIKKEEEGREREGEGREGEEKIKKAETG